MSLEYFRDKILPQVLAGLLIAGILGSVAAWTSLSSRVDALELKGPGNRALIEHKLEAIDNRLTRIERKLDARPN